MDARIFSRKDLNQSYIRFEIPGMKLNLLVAPIIGALLFLAPGQRPLTAQPAPDAAPAPDLLSEADLEQLFAPIALYPDPMVALILQASTVPTDIVLANRWLNDGNSPDDIDAQPWDDSVKGLARYPDVLQMMDDNLDWTNQLGAAVLAQQPDIMNAIQAMRAKAQALGNLQTTAQQQVISQDQVIQIVPANPQVIYVPVYDPTLIYVQPAPPIIFGPAFTIGIWLGGGCDWNQHRFYRSGYYRPGYGWGPRPPGNVIIWKPNPHRPPPRPPYRPGKPGHLPGWQKPPNWGKPRPPGNGKPPPGNTKPRPPGGNRPGNDRPSIQPVKPPGNQNPNKPGVKPAPVPETKPAPRPPKPEKPVTTQPVKPRPEKPVTTQPVKPQPKPAPTRPAVKPTPRPSPPSHEFDRTRPSTKPRPAPQQPSAKPAPARAPRPAPANQRAPKTQ
jgi:hypothetical protein